MQLAYNQTLDIMIKATDYKGGIFDDFKLCCPCCGERVEYIQDLGGDVFRILDIAMPVIERIVSYMLPRIVFILRVEELD